MADLKYKVDVDTDPAVRALARFNQGVGALEGALRELGSGGALGRLGGTLLGLGGAAGLGGLIARGMKFNQTLHDSEIAIANVLAQFQGLNAEAAKAAAAKAMQQLVELEPKTAGTLSDLTDGLLSTIASAQTAGISLKDNIDLVGRFANALANANIPANQLGQEFRSILTASIGPSSSLAKILQISNEDVKNAQASGTLVEFLVNKIGKLGESGDSAAAAFSSLSSAVDKVAGLMAEGLFENAMEGAKGLAAFLKENEEGFRAVGAAIGKVSKAGMEVAKLPGKIVEGVGLWDKMEKSVGGFFLGLSNGLPVMRAYENALLNFEERVNGKDQRYVPFEKEKKGADAAAAATDKLRQAIEALDSAEKKQSAGGGLEGDRDGDGIISKREQRRLDRDRKRAERRANAVGRNRGVVHDEFLGVNEWWAMQMRDNMGPREGERLFDTRAQVRAGARALSSGEFGWKNFQDQFLDGEGALKPLHQRRSMVADRINEALLPPGWASGNGQGAGDIQSMSAAEIISRLDALVVEMRKLNEAQ